MQNHPEKMTQIPDSAKRKIEELAVAYWQDRLGKFFPKAKGPTGTEMDMFKAGYHLAKSETPDRHELKEWKTSHPYFVTGSLVSDAEVKAYNAGQAYKTPEPRAE